MIFPTPGVSESIDILIGLIAIKWSMPPPSALTRTQGHLSFSPPDGKLLASEGGLQQRIDSVNSSVTGSEKGLQCNYRTFQFGVYFGYIWQVRDLESTAISFIWPISITGVTVKRFQTAESGELQYQVRWFHHVSSIEFCKHGDLSSNLGMWSVFAEQTHSLRTQTAVLPHVVFAAAPFSRAFVATKGCWSAFRNGNCQ